VLVVDKSRGPTSHDIVGRVRKAFDTGAVGHAGTLDPMATGVLVIAIGEATKLVQHLTSADKAYEATVSLGEETDSLDADGVVVGRAEVPALSEDEVQAAAERFVGATRQRAPVVSAIKVDGRPLHERARRGEKVEAPERDVFVHTLTVQEIENAAIRFSVTAAKGFYVRSLGRDLAAALGTVGHLTELRRTRSGTFDLGGAVPADTVFRAASGEADAIAALEAALIPIADAWSGPKTTLSPEGVEDARHGRAVAEDRRDTLSASEGDVVAMLDAAGAIVALGRLEGEGTLKVVRGFASTDAEPSATLPA